MSSPWTDPLQDATIRALRAAAAATRVSEARTWLPGPPRWKRAIWSAWRVVQRPLLNW